jgi:hypothetical protein
MRELKNKHVTRLGYPAGSGGALYYVSDQDGLCQMAVDLEVFRFLMNGVSINSETEVEILNDVKFERDIYNSKITNRGVPEKISALLQISKKSEAKKYCRALTISEFELFLFIQNCFSMGYFHKSRFPDFVPEHLVISDADYEQLHDGIPSHVLKKLGPLLKERKHITVHMFEKGQEWHCFYFSYSDIAAEKNHWNHGSHIHYVSYLWPQFTENHVWDSFETRNVKISGSLHIRFAPYEYPEMKTQADYPVPSVGKSPGAFAFDLALTSDCGAFPIPPAHVATRGSWVTNVTTK